MADAKIVKSKVMEELEKETPHSGGAGLKRQFSSYPHPIESLAKVQVRQISCGRNHSACVTATGTIYSWGRGDHGQLGHGDKRNYDHPVQVQTLDGKWRQVACGSNHTIALSDSGDVWSWGSNSSGQLGLGELRSARVPTLVQALQRKDVRQVAAGDAHSVALTNTAELYTWGAGGEGQLGTGEVASSAAPRLVKYGDMNMLLQVYAGRAHTIALTEIGEVWTWGRNAFGELGHGDQRMRARPELLLSLFMKGVRSMACGADHTACVMYTGELLTWGRNFVGQLGHSIELKEEHAPRAVQALSACRVIRVACGHYHTLALTDAGEVYGWGRGDRGQLGIGVNRNQAVPRLVRNLSGKRVMSLACGENHSLALTEDGRLLSWGRNLFGQLGHGDPGPERLDRPPASRAGDPSGRGGAGSSDGGGKRYAAGAGGIRRMARERASGGGEGPFRDGGALPTRGARQFPHGGAPARGPAGDDEERRGAGGRRGRPAGSRSRTPSRGRRRRGRGSGSDTESASEGSFGSRDSPPARAGGGAAAPLDAGPSRAAPGAGADGAAARRPAPAAAAGAHAGGAGGAPALTISSGVLDSPPSQRSADGGEGAGAPAGVPPAAVKAAADGGGLVVRRSFSNLHPPAKSAPASSPPRRPRLAQEELYDPWPQLSTSSSNIMLRTQSARLLPRAVAARSPFQPLLEKAANRSRGGQRRGDSESGSEGGLEEGHPASSAALMRLIERRDLREERRRQREEAEAAAAAANQAKFVGIDPVLKEGLAKAFTGPGGRRQSISWW